MPTLSPPVADRVALIRHDKYLFILKLLWAKSDSENDLQILDDIEIKCREN